jgi:hypothetical protein
MENSDADTPRSEMTIAQLHEEFARLNEQAIKIQLRMAQVTKQIAERAGVAGIPAKPDPSNADTVDY